MAEPRLITAVGDVPPSLARVEEPTRAPFRIGVVQEAWHPDADEHAAALERGIAMAAGEGARLVCLQELTLSPYFAIVPDALETAAVDDRADPGRADDRARGGRRAAARRVRPRLACTSRPTDGGLGYNTAIVVGPDGEVVAKTRKLHIPVTAGYYEDKYFRPGDDEKGYPVVELGDGRFGFPTCWDQWFPELARAYSLGGAEVIVYPTAIGSEPDHPDFDTQPLWERVIVGNGIANGTFMVARQPHRHRGAADVLRLLVHLRSLRARARAGAARRAGRARRRPRPRPAPRLARALPVPAHAQAGDLRGAARRGRVSPRLTPRRRVTR